jgi:DNA-binding CsgD family transcriptional regulator
MDLERRGMVAYLVEHHWFLANVHFVSGQWDDALAEIAASRQLAAETGIAGIGSTVPDPSPLVHLFRGDTAGAREAFATAERQPTVGSAGLLGVWWDPIRALVEDAVGDNAAALATLRARDRSLTELEFILDFRSIGRTVVRMCRAAGADDLLQNMLAGATEAYGRADGVKSVEGAALLVQGMIVGDSDRLLGAVEALRASGRPFDLAEACAEAALALIERGERDRGQQLAMEAFERYEELGARRQVALLAQDLREHGIRRGARRRRARAAVGWGALTESERRVVALVSEGLTNGEIGARLFISKGTVATHLRSVFRKLEVSSRAGLAAEAARHLS